MEQARAALPPLEQSYRARYPTRSIAHRNAEDAAGGHDRKLRRRLRHCNRGRVRVAIAAQCCELVAREVQPVGGAKSRFRMAIGASRRGACGCHFELLVRHRRSQARCSPGIVPIVPKVAANFLPFDPDTRVELSLACSTSRSRSVPPPWRWEFIRRCNSRADLVVAVSKEGGRGLNGSAQQLRLQIPIGAQVALSVTLLWRGVAHHQLCTAEPAEHRVSVRESLDRLCDFAAGALPRSRLAATIRGTNSGRTAQHAGYRERDDVRGHSATPSRHKQHALYAARRRDSLDRQACRRRLPQHCSGLPQDLWHSAFGWAGFQ